MPEDNELADSDDLLPNLGDEHVARSLHDLGQGGAVRRQVRRILFPCNKGPVREELDDPREVSPSCRADRNVTKALYVRLCHARHCDARASMTVHGQSHATARYDRPAAAAVG